MKEIIKWFKESNRWKHLVGGMVLGLVSDSWYCATLVGATAGGCLELKDKAHSNNWDWIDFGLTVGGALLGRCLHVLF